MTGKENCVTHPNLPYAAAGVRPLGGGVLRSISLLFLLEGWSRSLKTMKKWMLGGVCMAIPLVLLR